MAQYRTPGPQGGRAPGAAITGRRAATTPTAATWRPCTPQRPNAVSAGKHLGLAAAHQPTIANSPVRFEPVCSQVLGAGTVLWSTRALGLSSDASRVDAPVAARAEEVLSLQHAVGFALQAVRCSWLAAGHIGSQAAAEAGATQHGADYVLLAYGARAKQQ